MAEALPKEKILQIKELLDKGALLKDICAELNICNRTVAKYRDLIAEFPHMFEEEKEEPRKSRCLKQWCGMTGVCLFPSKCIMEVENGHTKIHI